MREELMRQDPIKKQPPSARGFGHRLRDSGPRYYYDEGHSGSRFFNLFSGQIGNDELTPQQIYDALANYLKEHPEALDEIREKHTKRDSSVENGGDDEKKQ